MGMVMQKKTVDMGELSAKEVTVQQKLNALQKICHQREEGEVSRIEARDYLGVGRR